MIYGYARVSTAAQDLGPHVAQLKAAGCEKIFREKITGTTADRPQLRKLMAVLTHGDVVITRRLTGSRATQPTFWLSPATCSAPGLASVRWPSRS
jgi:resolvase-like protein